MTLNYIRDKFKVLRTDHEYKLKQDYKLKPVPLLANIFRNMKLTLS